jgi:putative sterol carrier protein
MAIPFPSDAWIKALMTELNQSAAYLEAAKNWEGDFYFIIGPGGTLDRTVFLYVDLWHGKCREAHEVVGEEVANQTTPAFRLSAPVATWKKVITRKLDPMQGLMTGSLKLKGNMALVLKNVKAAMELVESSTHIESEFPI